MIIVNLKGGLGNQMFQYACGRALSIRNKDVLKLDDTGFARTANSDTPRTYGLGAFSIEASIATPEEIRRLKYPFGIVSKGWRFIKAKVFRGFHIGYSPSILNLKGDIYLDGFFQSSKYFADCEQQIRRDFTLKGWPNSLSPEATRVLQEIQSSSVSVSMHIRRGDYAALKSANEQFGLLGIDYYEKALKIILTKLQTNGISLFIFSDDIKWAQENMKFPYKMTLVSLPNTSKNRDAEELVLMSKCAHNVIANSSYSWWGAWLNANPDKIVVAPKRWAQKGESDFKDLIPESWIQI